MNASLFLLFHQMRFVHRLEPCEKTEPDSPPFLNKGIFLVANFGEKTLQKVTIVVIVMIIIIIIIIIIVAQAKSQTNMCLANVPSLRSPLAPTPPPRKGYFQVRDHFHFPQLLLFQVGPAQWPLTCSPPQTHPIT